MTDADSLSPAEAFSLVGQEHRFRMLEVLSRADDPLAFSDLRERVGVEDPGQFNYHLGKLRGRFVREVEDGYTPTPAGDRVVGAVLSGGITDTIDRDPIPLDATCERCDAPVSMDFPEVGVRVSCDECGFTVVHMPIPAGVLAGEPREAIPALVDRWQRRTLSTLDNRFCLHCDASMDVHVLVPGDPDAPNWVDGEEFGAAVRYTCERCESDWIVGMVSALLRRPSVVAFFHDHGLNPREAALWEQGILGRSEDRVVSRNPLRVETAYELDDATLRVTVDDDLTILDTERA